MKRFILMLAVFAALVAAQAFAAIGIPSGPYGPIQVRRNWGATTGTVDSTQFRNSGLTDGTASGAIKDTLNVINISNWNRFPYPGQGGITAIIGTLWVTFNNAAAVGASGDSLIVSFQFSIDGTNWTQERTAALYTMTAGTAGGANVVAAVPVLFDSDANVSEATGDIGQAQFMRAILRGDMTSKNVIASVYETHYDVRQPPN